MENLTWSRQKWLVFSDRVNTGGFKTETDNLAATFCLHPEYNLSFNSAANTMLTLVWQKYKLLVSSCLLAFEFELPRWDWEQTDL